MILVKILLLDFPVPSPTRFMKTTVKKSKIQVEDSNLLLLPITFLLQSACFDRLKISVYFEWKKHLGESSVISKINHSRITKILNLYLLMQHNSATCLCMLRSDLTWKGAERTSVFHKSTSQSQGNILCKIFSHNNTFCKIITIQKVTLKHPV